MNTLIALLIVVQIPVPNNSTQHFDVSHIQDRHAAYGQHGPLCKYRIQPFIQVASNLQKMDEQQRINRLSHWAKIDSLGEPTIILCRLLIEKKDGTPLRRPYLGAPASITNEKHPNEPLSYFEGVPFFVIYGYALGGVPEHATSYLNDAIKNGRWKNVKYSTIPEAKLNETAERFIEKHKTTTSFGGKWLSEFIKSQVGPPKPKIAR